MMATTPNFNSSPEALGAKTSDKLYELTRARLAGQHGLQRRSLGRTFAGRGGRQGTGFASAIRDLMGQEARQTAESSLQSQLAGLDVGFRESGRLEGIRQFDENLGFGRERLAQEGALTREGFANRLALQELVGEQAMEQMELRRRIADEQARTGMIGNIFSGGLGLLSNFLPIPGGGAGIGQLLQLLRSSGGGAGGGGGTLSARDREMLIRLMQSAG
jgi:hypothetical protein